MNIIPFDGDKLPAHFKTFNVDELNADITAHASAGFPAISIKGKQFAVVRDGVRHVLTNPKDPDSPATAVDMVLVKINKAKSKVFYLKGYDPKESEGKKPDCFSNEGVRPDPGSESPQSKSCATCQHNQWGAKISENGKKGKACADSVRVAVAPAGQLNDVMLLRVPPASIKVLGEYGQFLAKKRVAYPMVVTKVGFDMDAESPKLTFKPVGLLDPEAFAEVRQLMESDLVRDILGAAHALVEPVEVDPATEAIEKARAKPAPAAAAEAPRAAPTQPSKSRTVTDSEIEQAVDSAVGTKPKAKAAPVVAPEPDLDMDLDGIAFDD